MVECSPTTRAARVRFPDDASFILAQQVRKHKIKVLEAPGIDPGTSRMLSERSTIWATPPSMSWLLDIVQMMSGRQHCKLVFKDKLITVNPNDDIYKLPVSQCSFDSSVGRAVDCSSTLSDIHRSLVQIRLEGIFFHLNSTFYHRPDTCYSECRHFVFVGKSRHLL